MTENMKKYLALISTDEAARKQLNEQEPSSIQEAKEKIIADAAVKGITLTEEDFADTADTGELSEEELEAVAGGKQCYCVLGGGGTATHSTEKTCACVLGGSGEGDIIEKDLENPGRQPTHHYRCRCTCCVAGYGTELYEVP